MTVKAIYTSRDYNPYVAVERFVRARQGDYAWCERDALDRRYDVRQGTCDGSDLPANIRAAADRRLGHAFSYVEWSV